MHHKHGEDAEVVTDGKNLRDDEKRPRDERAVDFAPARQAGQRRAQPVAVFARQFAQPRTERPAERGEDAAHRMKVLEKAGGCARQPDEHRRDEQQDLHAHRPAEEGRHVHRFAALVVEQRRGHAAAEYQSRKSAEAGHGLARGRAALANRAPRTRAPGEQPGSENAPAVRLATRSEFGADVLLIILTAILRSSLAREQKLEVDEVSDFPRRGSTHGI